RMSLASADREHADSGRAADAGQAVCFSWAQCPYSLPGGWTLHLRWALGTGDRWLGHVGLSETLYGRGRFDFLLLVSMALADFGVSALCLWRLCVAAQLVAGGSALHVYSGLSVLQAGGAALQTL